jgi:hypothetical protein
MHHYFIEGVHTKKYQRERVYDEEVEIGLFNSMDEYRADQPQNKKSTYYGIEDVFSPVKKAPVVK